MSRNIFACLTSTTSNTSNYVCAESKKLIFLTRYNGKKIFVYPLYTFSEIIFSSAGVNVTKYYNILFFLYKHLISIQVKTTSVFDCCIGINYAYFCRFYIIKINYQIEALLAHPYFMRQKRVLSSGKYILKTF